MYICMNKVCKTVYYLTGLWLGKEEINVTWENENAIPKSVLQEFEGDSLVEVEKVSLEKIGQISHTLCVNLLTAK